MIGFSGFPKIVRLSRECIVTEKPEGIVVWHIAGNVGFKKTLGSDGHKRGEK